MKISTRASDVVEGSVLQLPQFYTLTFLPYKEFTVDKIEKDFPSVGDLTFYDHMQLLSLEVKNSAQVEVIKLP